VTFLATEALDFGDRDALDANAGEGFAHLIELERFDDGRDEFHVRFLLFKKAERLKPLLLDLDSFGQHHDERALIDGL
jgi:hypothetical protein